MHVTVFGSSTVGPDEPLHGDAIRLGAALAAAGHTVQTGGYHGLMAAVSEGAASAGGHVVGVTSPALFPDRTGPNGWVTEEVEANTLPRRVAELVDRADLVVALPGSIGTFAELVIAVNAAHLASVAGAAPLPILVVGDGWAEWVASMTDAFDLDEGLVSEVTSVDEAIAWLAPR